MSVTDVVLGVAALDDARESYIEADEMFNGNAPELFASTDVERDIAKTGAMGKVNLVKRITTTVANRVKLASVSVPDSEEMNITLNQIREANDMDLYEKTLIRNTLKFGDAYMTVWNIDPNDPSENDDMRQAGVSLNYNSPLFMRMIYDPQNERKALFAIKAWKFGKRRRADVYYRDRVERWITKTDGAKGDKEDQWQPYLEDIVDAVSGEIVSDGGIVRHDFGEIPVIHFRTDLTYGNPEAIDGYSLQRAINKALVTLVATIERTGYPVRMYLMYPEAALNSAGENPEPSWDLDETVPQSPTVAAPSVKDSPGKVKKLDGVRDVKEFPPSQPNVFLDPIMSFIKLMALATETPAYELNPSGEQPSGEARRQADKPLEAKVADRQAFLKGPFANLYRLALKAVGRVVKTVDVQWAPTSPINDSEGWSTIQAKQDAGVPVAQTLSEAGYSEEKIKEWTDNVAEATTLAEKLEYLSKISTAMKDLGTAVTLQVISPEQVEQIVDSLIASLEEQ